LQRPEVKLGLVVHVDPAASCSDFLRISGEGQDDATFQLFWRVTAGADNDYEDSRVVIECLSQPSARDRAALIQWLAEQRGVIDVRTADGAVVARGR
jgi:hypothetical protein